MKSIEVFLDCHPYSGAECLPAATKIASLPKNTKTVSLRLKAFEEGEHALYVQATDTDNYTGPITTHRFVI